MAFVTWLNRHYEERGPLKWLAFLLELLAAVALFLLMCLTCIDVVGRYFFSRPLIGATELTEIGLSFVIFAAMPVITWRGGHIVVDLIDSYVPSVVLKLLAWFSTILIATSFYFVAVRIFAFGARNLRRGIVTDFLFIPTGYVIQSIAVLSWLAAVGLVLCTIVGTLRPNKEQP